MEYESTYSFGDVAIGSSSNLTYKVYAKYDDDSKKELLNTDYTTEYRYNGEIIESLPSNFENIGAYNIKITYQGYDLTLSFNVVYASRTYQTVLAKTQWAYRDDQPELKISDNSIQLEEWDYRYIEKANVADPNNLTMEEFNNYSSTYYKENPLDPGECYLFVKVPQTGNYAETYSTLREVKVNKADITIDNADALKATYSYGNSVSGNFKATSLDFSPVAKFKEETLPINYTFEDKELNSTNNGETIQVSFTLQEADEKYYNTPAPMDVLLEINKLEISKPTIDDSRDEYAEKNQIDIFVGDKSATTWFGNWMAVELKITKPDGTTENINIDAETDTHILLDWPTKAGQYTYTLSLKDKVNYTWSDNTSEDVVKEIVVAGDDVAGKNMAFADLKILKDDGSEPTAAELESLGDLPVMIDNIKTANDNTTLNFERNGTVSGDCILIGDSTLDENIANTTPYFYIYNESRENTVEIFAKEGDVVVEDSKVVGNLVGDTLTLTWIIAGEGAPTGYILQFTFTLAGTVEA